jgi:site-specific recombinase XerD
MPIYKRGKKYWYHFWFNGEHIQESTKQGNPRVARQMEAAHKTSLAKGEVGIRERKLAPALKDFAQRFIDAIQVRCAEKPATIGFYAEKLGHLLAFEPLASARLDRIDESLIESYVQERSAGEGRRGGKLAPATVNRDLATLRRLLRLSHEWQLIDRVPRIRLLRGERNREHTLSHKNEQNYLAAAPRPLRGIATLMLDTGLRTSEVVNLEWSRVRLQPAPGAKFGYVHISEGKSKNARRNVPLTERVRLMLAGTKSSETSRYVFPSETGRPYRVQSVDHLHKHVREALGMSADFVIYSLRHSYGTRLGEAGADAFTIMRLMGHSSVTVSQRYVHPSPEAMERAVERLQALNGRALGPDDGGGTEEVNRRAPATLYATSENGVPVSY